MKKKLLQSLLFGVLFAVAAVLVWGPVWMLASGSITNGGELSAALGPVLADKDGTASWPLLAQYPTLRHYVELLLDTPAFFTMFWNSCKLVFPVLLGQLLVGAPAAWALARYRSRGGRMIFLIYIALLLLPFQVTMVSNYLVMSRLSLLDTRWSVILPGIFSTFPILIMTRFFGAIPQSVMEAAQLDGAGPVRSFFWVGLPLGLPGILSAVVLGFLEYWSLLEQPLAFFEDKALWPLSLYLGEITAAKAGVSLAASVIMLLPALLIFLFGQSHLEQGIQAAGLKE